MANQEISAENPAIKYALVVDDSPTERLAGRALLEKMGFSVSTAVGGEEALQFLSGHATDLVLCDIAMPDMDGLTLLELTRKHSRPPLFVMSSTHNDAEHIVASLRLGAYGYLTKPLRFERLRDTVAEVMLKYQEEQSLAQQAQERAKQDGLTRLMNKEEFSRNLAERLKNADIIAKPGALLLIKITGLNHINHSYSRAEGDRALQMTADELTQLVRPSDLLARFNGDVFSIYLDDIRPSHVEMKSASIIEKIEDLKIEFNSDAFSLSLALGAACSDTCTDVESLFNRADFALHLARENSRNRIHVYSEADEAHKHELSHQLNTLALVRGILHDHTVYMHYQPIVDLSNGKISHFEALLRMRDENGKPCNTGEVVKTCEVFGLIGRLDRAVIEVCFNDMVRLPSDTGIAINLSGKSIGDPDLLHFIEMRIRELSLDPSKIIFELTETAAFHNLDEVRHFVQRIKNLGCRFALDDFGVGFSSFYYIKELEFDYLKLDGSFIAHLPKNLNDQVFVRAMVEISKVFGLKVIAEWVEDLETATLLQNYGVTFGQGYYFGKPIPLA